MDILENIGRIYFEKRQSYMLMHNKGMTKFYNDIHNDKLVNPEIEECRKLRIELSKQVLESYYFNDIDLNYGFHNVPYLPENDQVRFTISESARKEVLYRLTELNHERYEIEVNSGFHGIASARNKPSSLTQRHATHRDNSVQVGLDF